MRSAKYKPYEQLTPFARLVLDFTRAQRRFEGRDFITVERFGALIGVSGAGIWLWMHQGSIPDRSRLPRIADVMGVPLAELYAACGYLPTAHVTDPWDRFQALAEGASDLDEEARAAVLAQVQRWRRRYAG